jgi:hypothetical protein
MPPSMSSIDYHTVEKSFFDYAGDIEAVNIHYVVTVIGNVPDWENYRATRFMPMAEGGTRKKLLKLPRQIESTAGPPTARYLLHYYFEIFQDGDRHYTPLFTEEINTDSPASPGCLIESQTAKRDAL